MHAFHHDCIMSFLSNQIDIYLVVLFKRRDDHPNDTLSQVSKPLSNQDAEDPAQLNKLLTIGQNLAKEAPSCPICQMNLMHPCLILNSSRPAEPISLPLPYMSEYKDQRS